MTHRIGVFFVIGLLASFALGGCATPLPELTREQYLTLVSRTYENITEEQAIGVAEKLLRLADPEDVTFQHFPDGFRAFRRWTFYIVLAASSGTDVWSIQAEAFDSRTRVTMYLQSGASNIIGIVAHPVPWTQVCLTRRA